VRLLNVALANVNTTVGAQRSNVDQAIALAHAAHEAGADLVAFPEQLVSGYPHEDLVQWRRFVEVQLEELARFARETAQTAIISVVGCSVGMGSRIYNCAALLAGGRIHGFVPKEKLPGYNVFYETRTLSAGSAGLRGEVNGIPFGDLVFDLDFGTVAIEVCEDVWSPDGPMRRRCYAGAELVVNLSASPFRLGIVATRREMLATRANDNQCTLLYTNLVGANDGLIFDGGGYVMQNGRVLLDAARFREGFSQVTVDLDRTTRLRTENTTWRTDQEAFARVASEVHHLPVPGSFARAGRIFPVPSNASFFIPQTPRDWRSPREEFCEDLLDALALGIGDYFEKNGVFKTIGVALSGGRDSLLCLWLARRWIDQRYAHLDIEGRRGKARDILRAFFMPSRYSSAETTAAAEKAAAELDAPLSIQSIDDSFERELAVIGAMLQPGEELGRMAHQNLQARIRAERMWTWANSAGGLFLQTSNMSEKAVGYSTIGGDGEGALAVIANVPKTVVNFLLDYLYERTESEAIRLTLVKPASAELAEGMEDERDLMPFPVLDACFFLYAGEKMSTAEVKEALGAMFQQHDKPQLDAWAERFARLFTTSIYKWVQAPLSLHVGNLDLERERALQLPVVQKREWDRPEL
jgi:NAD+ synthase (glutamine-hydrolysing)